MIPLKSENGKQALIWVDKLEHIEPNTLDQIKLMLNLPNLYNHIAIMPDTHVGKGAVVGGVVSLDGLIVPNIVGVDIGCGMSAINSKIKFDKEKMNKEFWMEFKTIVSRRIPVGFNKHSREIEEGEKLVTVGGLNNKGLLADEIKPRIMKDSGHQLGTLGGGNHFLEAQLDEDNNIWLMVHSGSRNAGLQISNYYNLKAKDLNEKYNDKTPTDLNFLRLDDEFGQGYLNDMTWAINYALENRWRMLNTLLMSLSWAVSSLHLPEHYRNIDTDIVKQNGINIHHNFANIENHFGKNVVVHRKGATQAYIGQIGIIPGSMGSKSYIVKGKGIEESFKSCSHGAGRVYSRTQAKALIKESDFAKSLEGTFTKASKNYIDEAPAAYKDIDEVMNNQKDLIEIMAILRPIITIKG